MPGSIPTPLKTYEIHANNSFVNNNSSPNDPRNDLFTVKSALIGFANVPCIVKGSSNGAGAGAMDGVDRWAGTGNLNWALAGSNHSWIVLEFPRINDGAGHKLQLCFDLNFSSPSANITIVVSPKGFSGGSATARPTASDEVSLGTIVLPSGSGTVRWQSIHATDGTTTHIIFSSSNVVVAWWMFSTVIPTIDAVTTGQPTGWDYPFVVWVEAASNLSNPVMTPANIISYQPRHAGSHAGIDLGLALTIEGGATTINSGGSGASQHAITSQYPMLPHGVWCNVVGARGRLGYIPDLWFVSTTAFSQIGSTLGEDDNHRKWAVFGCLVLPWTNDTTVPAGA